MRTVVLQRRIGNLAVQVPWVVLNTTEARLDYIDQLCSRQPYVDDGGIRVESEPTETVRVGLGEGDGWARERVCVCV